MKKSLILAVVLVIALCFSSCSGGVSAVVSAIEGLSGEASSEEISSVRAMYDALSDKQKEKVENAAALEEAENKFAAEKVNAAIDALLTSDKTTESGHIDADAYYAESAAIAADYEALSDGAKAYVTKYDAFKAVYDKYIAVKKEAVAAAAAYVGAYEGYTENTADTIKEIYCIYQVLNDENYFSFTCRYEKADGSEGIYYSNGSFKATVTSELLLNSQSIDSFFAESAITGYDGVNEANVTLELSEILSAAAGSAK